MKHIVIMAGGTGGHVYPALATAKELISKGYSVSWLGTPDSFESRLVPQHKIEFDAVNIKGLRGNGAKRLLTAPFLLTRSLGQALAVMRRRKPALVIGMGGFASGPGGVAARLTGTPLVIHEQNAIAGVTNKLLSKFATAVCEAFPGTFRASKKVTTTGNPVRAEIAAIAPPAERMARHKGPVQVLVVGGSLGAAILNEVVPAALALIDEEQRPAIGHQSGRDKEQETMQAYEDAGVKSWVVEFIDDMAEAYSWADLMICRSGALTVSELAAAGVASILVPYPFAVDDHQTLNARYLADKGAAVILQQRDMSAAVLAQKIRNLGRHRLLQMAQKARLLARNDATSQVVDICERVMMR
ncbi:MAG TPA: undecaprenyldiphospho-muramoylpentapeptide beta-N-acetylglucosaminyltransferase [Gammaproteobacteria bacterium]|nr:undecaprenyldiphospho-muramoylpentapeptide beta-N-acetylglucosaminyltransferase [Gammaproteobacteria bacterium]